jgi:hypothetical protein
MRAFNQNKYFEKSGSLALISPEFIREHMHRFDVQLERQSTASKECIFGVNDDQGLREMRNNEKLRQMHNDHNHDDNDLGKDYHVHNDNEEKEEDNDDDCKPVPLSTSIMDMLFGRLHGAELAPVAQASCHTLAIVLRNLKAGASNSYRIDVWKRLLQDCVQDGSCIEKILFLDICGYLCVCFNNLWSKKNVLPVVLKFAPVDKVLDVRMKFCSLFPVLRKSLNVSATHFTYDDGWQE